MKPVLHLPRQLRLLSLLLFLMLTTTLSAQGYRICLASFADSVNAGKLAEQLRLYGMETFNESIRVEGKNYIRVILDRDFPDAEAAQAVLNSLLKHPVMVFFQARSPWILPKTAATATTQTQQVPSGTAALPPSQAQPAQPAQPSPIVPQITGIAEASALLSAGQSVAAFSAADLDTAPPEEPIQAQSTPEPAAAIVNLDQAELIAPQVSDRPTPPEPVAAAAAELDTNQAEPEMEASQETPAPLTREQPTAVSAENSAEKPVDLAQAELFTPEIFAKNPAEPSAETNTAGETTKDEAEIPPSPAELASAVGSDPVLSLDMAATELVAAEAEPVFEPETAPADLAIADENVEAVPQSASESAVPELLTIATELAPSPEPEPDGAKERFAAEEADSAPEPGTTEVAMDTTSAVTDSAPELAPEPAAAETPPATEELTSAPVPVIATAETPPATEELTPAPEPELATATTTTEGRILFSTSPVPLDAQNNLEFPLSFSAPAPIYARAFFSEELGTVAGGDLWHELYIDGNFTKRIYFEQALESERMQIPLSITANSYADEFSDLSPGEYKIHIQVLRNKRDGQSLITRTGEDGLLYTEPVDILVAEKLSEGSFTYIVP